MLEYTGQFFYLTDGKGDRLSPNINGCFQPPVSADIWVKLETEDIKILIGDILHYSNDDIDVNDGDYMIEAKHMNLYRVRRIS